MPADDAEAGGVQVIRMQSHEMDIFCKAALWVRIQSSLKNIKWPR
jgi:hypothetical protein